MISQTRNIVFIGMPVADILIHGPASAMLMQHYQMQPGKRTMATADQVAALEKELPENTVTVPGGSLANTACTVSRLCPDLDLTFLCVCADDRYGDIFLDALHDAGLMLRPGMREGKETSRSYVVTDDQGERAIARYMGDSMDYLRHGYLEDALQGAEIVFIEGELLALPHGYELWAAILRTASAHQIRVGVTLFGAEQVSAHRQKFLDTIRDHAALLFGNIEELHALYPDVPDEKAYSALVASLFSKTTAQLVCISHGSGSALMTTRDGDYRVQPANIDKVVNTLGAGDGFMAGVLAGMLKGYMPNLALQLGHRVAGAVIQQEAPQLSHPELLL